MRGTSAAGRLLIELPHPFYWEGFEDEAFRRPCDYFEPGAPVGDSELCESCRSSAAAVTRSRSESSLTTLSLLFFSYCLAANHGSYPEKSPQPGKMSLFCALPDFDYTMSAIAHRMIPCGSS
jgi:hypothetical protein